MVMATAAFENYHHDHVTHDYQWLKKPLAVSPQNDEHAVQFSPADLIGTALHQRVEGINHELCNPGEEDTFFVADLGEVYRQFMRWKKALPRIKPFYAVKCNPDQRVLQLLSALGTGFDCASKQEIDQVMSIGVNSDRIIYAQPCKTNSYVRYVKSVDVKRMTFDNSDELYKIAKLFPGAELLLRIMTDDTSSLVRLSMKFGAAMETTEGLLLLAQSLGLNVVGVSFHIGSAASDPTLFNEAVRDAHTVFEKGRDLGFKMQILDVGGGFADDTFEAMASSLTGALDEYFPVGCGVDLIAEPGRYFVASAFTIACNVIARRTIDNPLIGGKGFMIYVNDGVYGNFSSIMYDHQHPVAKILRAGRQFLYHSSLGEACSATEGIDYSIWGPTCDGIDQITQSIRFKAVLDAGDWLYFENMGAYTRCSATQFNGFSNSHEVIYVCSELGAAALLTI